MAAFRSSSSETMSRSDSCCSALSTIETAPVTILARASSTASACCLRSMEEALKPFAKIADRLEDEGNEAALCAYDDKDMYERPISVGHFRKPRAALSGEKQ